MASKPGTLSAVEGGSRTVVVVEDDPRIADLVELYLRRDGFRVVQAPDGQRGVDAVDREHPDMVVVDVGLPGGQSGFDVCRTLRSRSDVPVLFLTARDEEVDRLVGLELGGDDYLTKPFSPRELVARIRAILRRTDPPSRHPTCRTLGSIEIDAVRREARDNGSVVPLATREFDLLVYLAEHTGMVLTRRQLLDAVWGLDWVGDERTVDVHVRQLRKKLGSGLPLVTVWGVGYRLG
jgi:DNA-binding response OmpR family regulator